MAQPILQHINGSSTHNNSLLSLPISISPKLLTPLLPKFTINTSRILKRSSSQLAYPIVQAMNKNTLIENKSSSNILYRASIDDEIKAHLKRVIPIRELFSVFEPMHHLTFVGPKSVAPTLCVAACELVGGSRAQAVPAASALHVMHAATQAHDYLTLSDRPSPKTRIKPTNHGLRPSIELQTGDGLLAFGYELLAGLNDPNDPVKSGRILQVIIEVSRAMGSQGLVEGQHREVECCELDSGQACQEGWQGQVYEEKGGVLHACAAACGAILGEANKEEVEKLRKFGFYVGTIKGMLIGNESKEKEVIEMIQNLRKLALKELEAFNPGKTHAISSFLNECYAS